VKALFALHNATKRLGAEIGLGEHEELEKLPTSVEASTLAAVTRKQQLQ